MIRVYFIFYDPLDDDGINLSYVDVRTKNPTEAVRRVEEGARSGQLWRNMYPENEDWPYELVNGKMTFLDISGLPHEHRRETVLSS
jgi:hypothetical protein